MRPTSVESRYRVRGGELVGLEWYVAYALWVLATVVMLLVVTALVVVPVVVVRSRRRGVEVVPVPSGKRPVED
jgi:hypothetical protein